MLIHYTLPEGERLGDVLRFGADEQEIRWLRYDYFCPELLVEVAAALGQPVHTNGYSYNPN